MTATGLSLARPASVNEATALAADGRFSLPMYKAGAIDIVDHMKEGLLEPDLLIDVRRVTRPGGAPISWDESKADARRIRIEAGTTLAEIAGSSLIGEHAPALAQASESAATPQVRNVATVGGNLLQRPRCWYYRSSAFDCLKKGGSRCFAADGENKFHAIFGPGPCHIVHPSNLAPPLLALGATVHVTGAGRDTLPIGALYHMPEGNLKTEHTLEPGELVTHVTVDPGASSGFYSIKEKESFDWPLVFAAVALDMDGDRITRARVVAGAVAPIPWALPEVGAALEGLSIEDEPALRAACALATRGAEPMSQNAYKLTLLPVAIRRATLRAAGRTPEDLHS